MAFHDCQAVQHDHQGWREIQTNELNPRIVLAGKLCKLDLVAVVLAPIHNFGSLTIIVFGMSNLEDLPIEILTLILRHVNLNGDLAAVRLVNNGFNMLIWEEHPHYFEDLCSRYGLSERVMDLYICSHGQITSANELCHLLHLRRDLGIFEQLSDYLKMVDGIPETAILDDESIMPFLLYSAFSRSFGSISHTVLSLRQTNPSIEDLVIEQAFRAKLDIQEIESLIAAISMCSSALWLKAMAERTDDVECEKNGMVGNVSVLQQAVLTEYVIRQGPRWSAQMLCQGVTPKSEDAMDIREIWRTSRADAARIASSGLARTLWRERTIKIEAETRRRERAEAERLKVSDMRVNAGVWRGSAGDM